MAPRICVAGVGAVGGLIAARLAQAGHGVCLIARGARLRQVQDAGLRVEADGVASPGLRLEASDRPVFGVQDFVFLAVKAQALPALVPHLMPMIGPDTCVIPVVNGIPWWYFLGVEAVPARAVVAVDPGGALLRLLAQHQIAGCVAFLTSALGDDGVVVASGTPRLRIGEIDGVARPRTGDLAGLLSAAGVHTSAVANIRAVVWTKLALNLATNPLSVVSGAGVREMFTDPNLLPVATAVMEEARGVAARHGEEFVMSLDQMLEAGRSAGPFATSMLQDFTAGRPLELGAIGHSALELAAEKGLDMPTVRCLVMLAAHRAGSRM
jgi:2-dehydropantoate 2-reductase